LLVLLVLGGVLYVIWLIAWSAIGWVATRESQLAAAIVAAAGTLLASVAAVVYSQQRLRKREIAESHRAKKAELYSKFIKEMIELLMKYKGSEPDVRSIAEDAKLQSFFMEFTSDLMLWGSRGVINKYSAFRSHGQPSAGNVLLLADDLLRAMRKDLGHSNLFLGRGELIKLLLSDPEKLDQLSRTKAPP